MGWSAVRRSFSVAVVSAVALAAPAQRRRRASPRRSSGRPPADVDEHRRACLRRHRARRDRHPGQRHRHRRRGHAPAARTRAAARSRRTSSTATIDSKWLVFEPTGWVRARARRAGQGRALRARPRPTTPPSATRSDWTLQGSNDGTTWTTLDTRTRPDVRAALPDEGVPASPTTVAYRHYRLDITAQPRRRTSSSSPSCSSPTATPARRRRATCAAPSAAGPRGGYNAKSGVGFTGVRALAVRRRATPADGPRLLLQQGLRRRRRASRRRPSCRT